MLEGAHICPFCSILSHSVRFCSILSHSIRKLFHFVIILYHSAAQEFARTGIARRTSIDDLSRHRPAAVAWFRVSAVSSTAQAPRNTQLAGIWKQGRRSSQKNPVRDKAAWEGASWLGVAVSGRNPSLCATTQRAHTQAPVQTILAFDPSSNTCLLYYVCKPPARRAESIARAPADMGRRRPAAAAAPVRAPPGLPRSRKSRSTWPATLAAGTPPQSRRNRCKRCMDKQRTHTKAN